MNELITALALIGTVPMLLVAVLFLMAVGMRALHIVSFGDEARRDGIAVMELTTIWAAPWVLGALVITFIWVHVR